MCDQHSNILVNIPGATPRGPLGTMRGIDECIAPLVDVLNQNGYSTVASCCGHRTHYGSVALEDGRWLVLMPDADFRAMDTTLEHKEE